MQTRGNLRLWIRKVSPYLQSTNTLIAQPLHICKTVGSMETVREDRWISTNPFFLTEQRTKAYTLLMLNILSSPCTKRT